MSSIQNLLLIIVISLVLYLFNILSFIFIPLAFGLFGALLFSPLMRWFTSKRLPRLFGLIFIVLVISVIARGAYEVVYLATEELESVDAGFIDNATYRMNEITDKALDILGIEMDEAQEQITAFFKSDKVRSFLLGNVNNGLSFAINFISILLMSLFFMVLFLFGSIDVEKVLESLIFKEMNTSKEAYRKLEKNILVFVLVKLIISAITGFAYSVVAYSFGVSFPIFWGVLAFLLNFIQVVGPILSVVLLSLFATIEMGFTGGLIFFTLLLIAIQTIGGGILEPILMGKSLSMNTISILVMLSIWGFVWGIPGMILSIPITVVLKVILERFPSTKTFSDLIL
ncbi:MAG: AI-2E family transporter [Brumimicrobium sp.]|nr:AI-2E family transporter [Brumimicrobium sp.]